MKEILADIKKQEFMPVYLLYGPEDYLRKSYTNQLLQALISPDDMMNLSRFRGEASDPNEIIDLGKTEPFFADRRVILLEDTGFFKSASDSLADFISELPSTLVMVFSEEAIDKRNRLYKAVAKHGRVAEFARQREDRLASWVAAGFYSYGKEISPADARYFVGRTGVEMTLLRTEMEKLVSYTGDSSSITRADIEAICPARLEDRIFDMLAAIADRKQQRALDLFYDLVMLKESPVKILVLLGRHYNQLRKAKELQRKGLPAKELSALTGIPPFSVKNAVRVADTYTLPDLIRALSDIVQTDEAIKTGRITDQLAVELLIIRLSQSRS